MTNYWNLLWKRVSAQDMKTRAEVERIAALQQDAAHRRAEYAEEKERAAQSADASTQNSLASSRKRMEEAEIAHTAALQTWENTQSRMKPR